VQEDEGALPSDALALFSAKKKRKKERARSKSQGTWILVFCLSFI
jgi:hypothetical protein